MRTNMTQRLAAIVATGTLAISLTACDDDDDNGSNSTQPATTGTVEDDQNAELRELYADALDNLDPSTFASDGFSPREPTGAYEYAMVDITGDDIPEMLVKSVATEISSIRLIAANEDRTALVEPDHLFGDGAGSAGGERLELHTRTNHDGLLASDGRSGTGQYTTTEWELDGDQLQETGKTWEYRIDQKPADLEQAQAEIPWSDSRDRSALENLGEAEDAPEAPDDDHDGPNPDPPASSDDSAEEPDTLDEPAANTGGRSKADFPNFGANSATSDEFARAVYNSWIDQYIATGETAPTLNVASPVTGESYAMNCTYSVNVTCSGGNNARVMIHPPAPDPASIPGGVMWG
ncbi:hypothetical protein [Corynebacterium glyciniphilum]|uniref:hypothetical protein n=1 Tax=Corynebacterium glyciniphilum TaxID=1404244 RepID=UPI0011AB3A49|nr:hypothetical protein [Corynebacterium glyciniphilum]